MADTLTIAYACTSVLNMGKATLDMVFNAKTSIKNKKVPRWGLERVGTEIFVDRTTAPRANREKVSIRLVYYSIIL